MGKANIFPLFPPKSIFFALKVKILKKLIKDMQKFIQFYVTYWNIVQFDHNVWNLDYLKKSVIDFMANPVPPEQFELISEKYSYLTRSVILRPSRLKLISSLALGRPDEELNWKRILAQIPSFNSRTLLDRFEENNMFCLSYSAIKLASSFLSFSE